MDSLIQVFDNTLDEKACDDLIDFFNSYQPEDNDDKKRRYELNMMPNFTLFKFTKLREQKPELHDYFLSSAQYVIGEYRKRTPASNFWPEKYGFEEFKVKYYNKDLQDQFTIHTDATTLERSKRFFAFFWYLNDVEQGGETEFPDLGIKIKPKKGRIVMFPPFWMYPHIGHPPISNDKYLLSVYLHYVDNIKPGEPNYLGSGPLLK